ncbi:MAG: hypothetical protein R3C02_13670 [Planctomycetaceae bacterium]
MIRGLQHARLRSQREHAQQSQQYRQMQLAMLHLDQEPDPDFRRAASAARAARGVAANLRQRQYGRLRPMLVQHYRRCRSRGTAAEILLESLVELVEALGMPEYEADYIRQEAERTQQTRPTASPVDSVQEFQQRLSQAQQEHEQRIQAIRTLSGLNDDTRAQLLEAEEQRYQSRLFGGRDS